MATRYIQFMASLQRVNSGRNSYWRLVESFRRPDGKPAVRVIMHIGKANDLLARLQQLQGNLRVHSVSSGAVDALAALAKELGVAESIDNAITTAGGQNQVRDGLSVGQSLLIAAIARVCHPSSKRAIAPWSAKTSLPERFGVEARDLTSQHFWDQMNAMPLAAISSAEEEIVAAALRGETVSGTVAYDTTNFHTHIDTTNDRCKLPCRGHNKQRRHDLRQLSLALVVDEKSEVPLGHVLYEGRRSDSKAFAEVLTPLCSRIRRLCAEQAQLTMIFDQGAETRENLERMRAEGHFVTALKPSHHRPFLAQVADRLQEVTLPNGEAVRALRTRLLVHGVEQTVVVVHSERLHSGQRRGLEQHLSRALKQIRAISPHPRGGISAAQVRVKEICNRQYLRDILDCEILEQEGQVVIQPRIDEEAWLKLDQGYFGLRILATDRDDWSTEQIIAAYRGQSRVERAFRDLKDPWSCAFRPQHHWTDQKLLVHAFIAVLGLILGRMLLWRAQRQKGFRGTVRSLISKLATVRTATFVEMHADGGRPRVRHQIEECDEELKALAVALKAIPSESEGRVYTGRRCRTSRKKSRKGPICSQK